MSDDADRSTKAPREKVDPFGKGYIRPTRSTAEANPEKFYELIAYLRAKRKLTWDKVGDVLGIDETNASRRVRVKTLDVDERKMVLDYIYDESSLIADPAGSGIGTIRDSLYYAFLNFYDIKATSQDNARAMCVGTYQLWRHSVEGEGEFVRGRLDFYEDEQSGALCVKMTQPRQAREGMRASTEEFGGYFFRVADMYAMILRDTANGDLRMTIYPRFRIEKIGTDRDPNSVYPGLISHIVHMDGFGMGIDGNNLFFSPVYVELVDNKDQLAALDAKLDVVPEASTPKRILSKLRRYPIIMK